MATQKIQATKNYRLFKRSHDNRPTDTGKRGRLVDSMKKYGFLKCYPIVCGRDSHGALIVKDGQHRLAIAEKLGLVVHWIEEQIDFDISEVNSTQKAWCLRDHADKHAKNGKKDYQEGLDFSAEHGLPIGSSFALLAGLTSFNHVQESFIDGTFKVRDRSWASQVAFIYKPLAGRSAYLRNARFLEACMAVCRVKEFEPKRLLQNSERCQEKIAAFSTRDAFLQMLEDIYNFGRAKLMGLKAAATMAMRERNPAKKKAAQKAAQQAA